MALQFVDIALAADPDPGEKIKLHRLKGELLGLMGDNEPSYIARNIFYNGHNKEMKLPGRRIEEKRELDIGTGGQPIENRGFNQAGSSHR